MRRSTITATSLLLLQFAIVASSLGQVPSKARPGVAPQIRAVRVQTPPTIDGVIDEATEWKDVPVFEGLHDQTTGGPCPENGQFWLSYDKDFIYFAARMSDSQPKSIRAVEYRSNVSFNGDDSITLNMDLAGSISDFSTFTINPRGATGLTIAGGRAAKREWLGEFTAKARITETGWEAEARIPWKILPIPGHGKRNARFNVYRFISRLQQTFAYTYTGSNQTALTPIWNDVEMPTEKQVRKIQLLPYVYTGDDRDSGGVANAGLDIKAPLTETVNLVGTVNPDFRNIENQILSLDFSRFERLVSESRPFFLEGRDYYNSQIFTSQRIGSFDTGLNTYGKIDDKTSFGLLDTHAFGRENDFAVNATRQFNADSSVRATITSKESTDQKNQAYLLRYAQNVGPYGFFVRSAGSNDSVVGIGQESDVNVTYNKKEWFFIADHENMSANYGSALAYDPENDLKGENYELSYNKSLTKGPFLSYGLDTSAVEFKHFDGGFYRREYAVNINAGFRKGLGFNYLHDLPDFEGERDHLDSILFSYPNTNPYRNVSVSTDWGTQALIPYHIARVSGAYRTLGKLDLNLSFQALQYSGYSDQVILSGNYDMGRDQAISGRIVKQGSTIDPYIAFRRSGNAGAEYFLILGNPNTAEFKSSLILKVTYPIEKILGR